MWHGSRATFVCQWWFLYDGALAQDLRTGKIMEDLHVLVPSTRQADGLHYGTYGILSGV